MRLSQALKIAYTLKCRDHRFPCAAWSNAPNTFKARQVRQGRDRQGRQDFQICHGPVDNQALRSAPRMGGVSDRGEKDKRPG